MTDINTTTAEPTPAATIPEPVSAVADATSARSRRKSRVGLLRRDVARINTLLRQREIAAAEALSK